ncbi:hypothetical protein D9M68_649970 [compost metagenome]
MAGAGAVRVDLPGYGCGRHLGAACRSQLDRRDGGGTAAGQRGAGAGRGGQPPGCRGDSAVAGADADFRAVRFFRGLCLAQRPAQPPWAAPGAVAGRRGAARRPAVGAAGQRHSRLRPDPAAVSQPVGPRPRSAAVSPGPGVVLQRRLLGQPDRQPAEHPDRPGRRPGFLVVHVYRRSAGAGRLGDHLCGYLVAMAQALGRAEGVAGC